jgi:glutamine cyclotransferase
MSRLPKFWTIIILIGICGALLYYLLLVGGRPQDTTPTPIPIYTYSVVRSYPHDPDAFTQGLAFDAGMLYEGTGIEGRSSLRLVELETGRVLRLHELSDRYFGEGITVLDDRVIQLTYRSNVGFVYDKADFTLLGQFSYPTEGWGLTHDGTRLIMSDGTSVLHLLDPGTLEEVGRVSVRDGDRPVDGLNELEYVRGRIFANLFPTDRIAIIDPATGLIEGYIDLRGLPDRADRSRLGSVLNGIAYDHDKDRLFVTGKLWSRLIEIRLIPLH